jgi:hypothetical protein
MSFLCKGEFFLVRVRGMYHSFFFVLKSALVVVTYQHMPVRLLLGFMELYLAQIHVCIS